MNEWKNKYPDFSAAIKRAKQECENYYTSIMQMGMMGRKKNKNGEEVLPNYQATPNIFFMKACFRWRDDMLTEEDSENEIEFV